MCVRVHVYAQIFDIICLELVEHFFLLDSTAFSFSFKMISNSLVFICLPPSPISVSGYWFEAVSMYECIQFKLHLTVDLSMT